MKKFSTSLALCGGVGDPPVTGGVPSQRPVMQSFDFFWSAAEQTFEQIIETPVISDTIMPIMTLMYWYITLNSCLPVAFFNVFSFIQN